MISRSTQIAWLKVVFFVLALSTVQLGVESCAHRVGSNAPPTPYENVLVSNAILASVNHSVTDGVIAVNKAGLLSAEKTKPVLDVTYRIATLDDELTTILAKGPEGAKADAAKIQSLVTQIHDSALALVENESLGVKNPVSKATLRAEVDAITVLAGQVLANLHAAGVL